MIGYVQGRDIPAWSVQLDRWIEGLAGDAVEGWSDTDKLAMVEHDTIARIASLRRSEEHTSELQSLMRISYAVFCLKKKITKTQPQHHPTLSPKHNDQRYIIICKTNSQKLHYIIKTN